MHIVPLIVGDEREALRLCQGAIEQGVFAQAIRPPTVAGGTSRLRLTAMASHTAAELRTAAGVLGEVARAIGLDPAAIGPPLHERRATDVETFTADAEPHLAGGEPLEPFFPEHEPDVAIAERDAARTAGRERLAAAVRSRTRVPFDAEGANGETDEQLPAGAIAQSAPFDIERETAVPRAA